jgi:Tfp pilus assembly protein PilX
MIFPARSDLKKPQSPRAGFALLITIVLMSMMVLMMVSMAALTRVETQIAANYQKTDQARENALFALKLALGQLQKHVGPDQRATARADLLNSLNSTTPTRTTTDSWSGSSVTPQNSTVFHNNSLLTGVWGNSADSTAAAANSAYVNTPKLLTWLVSGNESARYATKTTGVDFGRVDTAVTVIPGTYTADTAFSPSTTNPAVQLIGPVTVGGSRNSDGTITATDAQKAAMVAAITQPITVASRLVPGLAATDTPVPVGRYAYWVGDEGVKAKFNIVDPWGEPDATTTTDAQKRYRYQVAQRAGIELMTRVDATTKLPDGPIGSASYDQAGANGRLSISKMISYNSIPLGNAVTQATTQARFHDLTTYSYGVLSNTRDGGLKKDLTAAFAPGTTSATAPTGKLWTIPAAALGTAYGANMLTNSNAYDGLGPDWQVLRCYAQLGASVTGTGTTASMDPIAPAAPASNPTEQTQMGVFPVVAGYRLYVSTKLVKVGAQYQLELRLIPTVMLWNPYNVTLKNATYGFAMDFQAGTGTAILARIIQSTSTTTQAVKDAAPAINASAQVETPYFYSYKGLTTTGGTARSYPLQFEVATGDMAPGRAYTYTLPNDLAATDAVAANYTAGSIVLTRGWAPGGTLGYGLLSQSPTFAAPATLPAGSSYSLRFFYSGLNKANMPNWDEATTSGNYSSTRLVMRLGSVSGAPLQTLDVGQLATQNTTFNTVYRSLGTSLSATVDGPCWGYKAALKATAFTGTGIAINTTTNALVPWISAYNPRATNSSKSAWENQKVSWNGYYNINPSFGFYHQTGASGPVTAKSDYSENESGGYYPFGASPTDATTTPVVLYDIPRANQPLQSLGALQHADLYRASLDTTTPFPAGGGRFANNAAPAYVVGNSKVDQRGDLALPYSFFVRAAGNGTASLPVYYDHSFLANRALWDGYCFSTVPTTGALTFPLPNGRHVLAGAAKTNDNTVLRDADLAASRLLVDGSFNINSTSEEAWRAVLASTLNVPVGSQPFPDQAPVPRLLYPASDSAVLTATSGAETKTNSYGGYRALSSAQITALATQIVAQVKARGPFVSLADFVNRALLDTSADAGTANDKRLGGALHTAIAAAGINSAFNSTASVLPAPGATYNTYPITQTAATGDGASPAAASPGWVTQADLLQVLGPVLSARSDTFVVRTYGEVLDPLLANGDPKQVQARAWAEAIVQRMPEYVDQADPQLTNGNATPPAVTNTTNQNFGRRLKIIHFRWLSPSDI